MQIEGSKGRNSVVPISSWLKDRASKAGRQGDLDGALSLWRRYLKHSSKDALMTAEAHYELGLVNDRLGEATRAVFHFGSAVRLEPSNPRYHQAFGRTFLNLHHFRLAKGHFEEAIRLEPANDCHWRHYSWALFQAGDLDRALKAAKKALQLKPQSERCLWLYVHLLTEKRLWKDAARTLQQWRRVRPHSKRLQFCIEFSQKKFSLSLQGAVHQFIRKRLVCDGKPFQLAHIRAAEQVWSQFCERYQEFSQKRAQLRLVRIWALASAIFSLKNSFSGDYEKLARRYDIKTYELEAAVRIVAGPDLGEKLVPHERFC